MQLEFNFPITMTCIHYTTLHLRIPKREKILVKLPHLTQQHHLPNQHGAKIGLTQKCKSIFFVATTTELVAIRTDFSQRFQFVVKKLYFMKERRSKN